MVKLEKKKASKRAAEEIIAEVKQAGEPKVRGRETGILDFHNLNLLS